MIYETSKNDDLADEFDKVYKAVSYVNPKSKKVDLK